MDKDLNFRHVIKTFVPGLFATISIFLIFDLLAVKIISPEAHLLIKSFIERNSTLTASLMIPISLFIGITINTLCFIYLIPGIIDRHKEKEKQRYVKEKLFPDEQKKILQDKTKFNFYEFCQYKDSVVNSMNVHYHSHLFGKNSSIEFENFNKHFDLGSFLLHRKNIANLNYIKTGYWYYLEFQLNSIISILLGIIALNLNLFFREIGKMGIIEKFSIFLSSLIIGVLLCILMYKAIIRNLERDQKKELSYVLGAFHICRVGNSPT